MRWRIYYGDGTTFSDRDGSPFDAPATNVQVVFQEGPMYGKDAFYWREDIGWNGCDIAGLWDYLMMYQGPKAVLFGRTLRNDAFWACVEKAISEKTG